MDWSRFSEATRKQIQKGGTAPTDASGFFTLNTTAPCVIARKVGYRSQRLMQSDSMPARVVLLQSNKPPPRACSSSKCRTMSSPGGLCLGNADGFKTSRPAIDVDYTYQDFWFRTDHGPQGMRHGSGLLYSSGVPLESLACYGDGFQESVSQVNDTRYVDARGRNADGSLWCYVGRRSESIDYWKAVPISAQKFDSLLDGLCIMKPAKQVSPFKSQADKIIR